ncbi:MAG: response regulator transcription factor [Thermomicrobiales bacterium]
MSDARNATILVVGDDALFVRLTAETLRAAGYRVETTGRDDDVLACIARSHPSLIMLSLVLPDADGIALCRRIRREAGCLPGIFLMGHHTAHDLTAGLAAGADDYLTRFCHTEELLARVRAALRRTYGAAALSNE